MADRDQSPGQIGCSRARGLRLNRPLWTVASIRMVRRSSGESSISDGLADMTTRLASLPAVIVPIFCESRYCQAAFTVNASMPSRIEIDSPGDRMAGQAAAWAVYHDGCCTLRVLATHIMNSGSGGETGESLCRVTRRTNLPAPFAG